MDNEAVHKKKLLFVIESLQCGGAEKSLTTLLQNLDYSKYQVSVLITQKGGEFEKFVPDQVTLIYKNVYKGVSKITSFMNRLRFLVYRKMNASGAYHTAQLYWKAFGGQIKKHEDFYDIAIAYNQGFSSYYVATKVSADKKIAWLNTDYQKAGYQINFDKKFYTKYNTIVCVSKENEESLLKEASGYDLQLPTIVIKDITDHNLVRKMSNATEGLVKAENQINVLTVGRLTKAKGLDMAIEACKLLKNQGKNIKWSVIGEGPDHQELQQLIEANDLNNEFELLGFKENPYPFMKSCDIYAQTSFFEGLGLTVIEASILQKPIVTTNFPTASSIITHQKSGWICEMNAEAIAEGITKYMDYEGFKDKVVENLGKLTNEDKEESLKNIDQILTN